MAGSLKSKPTLLTGGGSSVPNTATVTRGTAPPITETFVAGDTRWNTATSGPAGWRCTVGGTPGTWVAIGVKRTATLTDASSVTIDVDSFDGGVLTTLSQTTNFVNPTGTPVNGQQYLLRIKSTTARSLTWDTQFRGGANIILPATTTGSGKTDYYGFSWNSADSKWDLIANAPGY